MVVHSGPRPRKGGLSAPERRPSFPPFPKIPNPSGQRAATREAHGLQPNSRRVSRYAFALWTYTSRVQKERARIKENALRQSFLMGSERWDPICEKELSYDSINIRSINNISHPAIMLRHFTPDTRYLLLPHVCPRANGRLCVWTREPPGTQAPRHHCFVRFLSEKRRPWV